MKATFSHNRMSSNNICLCFSVLLCIIVFKHLHVNTPLIYHYLVYFVLILWIFFFFNVLSVYLTGSVPGWRTKNLTWPVWLYILFSHSLPHSLLFIHHI